MRTHRLSILFVVPAVALVARLAYAQCPDDVRAAVERELEITDTRIEQAESVVSSSDHPEARAELQIAVGLQAQARSELLAGHCAVATDLTRRARARALRAISMVRGLPDPDRVGAQLDRTREILDRARDRIEECNDERAQAIIRAASEMQLRAEAAFAADPPRLLAAL